MSDELHREGARSAEEGIDVLVDAGGAREDCGARQHSQPTAPARAPSVTLLTTVPSP